MSLKTIIQLLHGCVLLLLKNPQYEQMLERASKCTPEEAISFCSASVSKCYSTSSCLSVLSLSQTSGERIDVLCSASAQKAEDIKINHVRRDGVFLILEYTRIHSNHFNKHKSQIGFAQQLPLMVTCFSPTLFLHLKIYIRLERGVFLSRNLSLMTLKHSCHLHMSQKDFITQKQFYPGSAQNHTQQLRWAKSQIARRTISCSLFCLK